MGEDLQADACCRTEEGPGEAAALVASLVAVGPYISATAKTALDKLLSALLEEDRSQSRQR
jgi:hypothetical protein